MNPSKILSIKQSKHDFTKGEKCLFFHVIAFFVGILTLIVIYFIHLCYVDHDIYDVLKLGRSSSSDGKDHRTYINTGKRQYIPLGAVFLDTSQPQYICNSLLLRKRWSLVPGHCAAMRSDPDLSMMLPYWRIRYVLMESNMIVTTDIVRSIPHPHLNRQNMYNNVGLLEHGMTLDTTFDFLISNIAGEYNHDHNNKTYIEIVTWDWEQENPLVHPIKMTTLNFMPFQECFNMFSSITNLRTYEFCATIPKNHNLCFEHGALFLLENKIVGFFSWGGRCGNGEISPVIAANILTYKDWLKDMMNLK